MINGKCNETRGPTGRVVAEREGGRGVDGAKQMARLLTSLAATLLDPLRVRDVVVTSFAVEKCSESDTVTVLKMIKLLKWK